MHLFIGKPHLDLAKTADTLLTPVFAIGKYNTSVHSSRITAAVKCHLTDRRVLAFLNRQQAGCCEGLHSSSSPRFTASCGPAAKGSASPSQPLADRGHRDAWAHKKAQTHPNPAETQRWAVPVCELTRGHSPFSIQLCISSCPPVVSPWLRVPSSGALWCPGARAGAAVCP